MSDTTITQPLRIVRGSKHEADEQLKITASFHGWLEIFELAVEPDARRVAAQQIRSMARTYLWLSDQIPQDIYESIYRVRCASGTVHP